MITARGLRWRVILIACLVGVVGGAVIDALLTWAAGSLSSGSRRAKPSLAQFDLILDDRCMMSETSGSVPVLGIPIRLVVVSAMGLAVLNERERQVWNGRSGAPSECIKVLRKLEEYECGELAQLDSYWIDAELRGFPFLSRISIVGKPAERLRASVRAHWPEGAEYTPEIGKRVRDALLPSIDHVYAESRLHWPGVLANTASFGVPIALLWLGVAQRLELAASRRRQKRERLGLCIKCSHALAGLPEGAPCPECGHSASTQPQSGTAPSQ